MFQKLKVQNGTKGTKRFKKVRKGTKRFKKVQKGTKKVQKRYKKVQNGTKRYKISSIALVYQFPLFDYVKNLCNGIKQVLFFRP